MEGEDWEKVRGRKGRGEGEGEKEKGRKKGEKWKGAGREVRRGGGEM